MYPNGYAPQPQQRRRRSDRYDAPPVNQQPSSAQFRQPAAVMQHAQREYQPQQSMPGQAVPRQSMPQQGVPQQAQQMPRQHYPQGGWQQPVQQTPQSGYGRGYHPPQNEQWSRSQARYEATGHQIRQSYQPPVQPPQPPKQDDSGSGSGKPGFNWKVLLIAVVLLALLGVGGMTGMQAYEQKQLEEYVAGFDDVYCQNVYVDGIHLGGMTRQQAYAAVQAKAQTRNDAWYVRLTYMGTVVTELRADQLGMTTDITAPLEQAWKQGHTGTAEDRLAAMEALGQQPYLGYTALPDGDTSVVDSVLQQIANKVYTAPQDAAVLEFDPAKTNPFSFKDEVPGYMLDTAPIKERIYQMVSTMESGVIEIVPTPIQPKVTRAVLEKNFALRASASTKISTTSTEERTNNIRRAFELINGTIIQPGQEFSFNGIVGERSTENGFFPAIEYAYNEQVMGVGGGVCQASSTVYQAAVTAGMEITHREQHSLEVNYAEFGMDATVFWSKNRKIDFAFRNNTESPIYIVAAVQSDPDNRKRLVAKVSIYGADLGNTVYKLEARTVEILMPPEEPKYVKDKKQEYVTYTDQEKVVQKAADGYIIESYRVTYVDGVETERALLYTDRYEPKQKLIYVGTKTREK